MRRPFPRHTQAGLGSSLVFAKLSYTTNPGKSIGFRVIIFFFGGAVISQFKIVLCFSFFPLKASRPHPSCLLPFPIPLCPVFVCFFFHPRSFYFIIIIIIIIIIHFLFLFNIHKICPARQRGALVLELPSQHDDAVSLVCKSQPLGMV